MAGRLLKSIGKAVRIRTFTAPHTPDGMNIMFGVWRTTSLVDYRPTVAGWAFLCISSDMEVGAWSGSFRLEFLRSQFCFFSVDRFTFEAFVSLRLNVFSLNFARLHGVFFAVCHFVTISFFFF